MNKRASPSLTKHRHAAQENRGNGLASFYGLLILIAGLALIFSLLPFGTALEFGGDEGYELMKGFLCSKGYVMYRDIWNDQPPIFTLLLSNVFKVTGPSLLAARLVAAGFGLLMFVAFFELVRQRLGQWSALLAAFFLAAAPTVLMSSVSVMLEVPAFGVALIAALFLMHWRKRPRLQWLLVSGAVVGLALQIKLTAVVVVPAMLAEIMFARHVRAGSTQLRAVLFDLLRWGGIAGVIFILIQLVWGGASYEIALKSHFASHAVAGLVSPESLRFSPRLFLGHPECAVAALIAVLLVIKQGLWRELSFPLVLLATALAIHLVHRPWWDYYYLHLAIPIAWLAGFALIQMVHAARQFLSSSLFRFASPMLWKGIGSSAVIALILAMSEMRLEAGVKSLRHVPLAGNSQVLAKMREYASQTHWAYSQRIIYPFQAGLAVPPELAVVVLKRFWSGQITTREIVDLCRRYRPEQIFLFKTRAGAEWKGLLDTGYFLAYQDKDSELYVSKQLLKQSYN